MRSLKLDDGIFKLSGIHKSYSKNVVLDDLELSFTASSIVGIFGESGSGKTTLMSILGLLDTEFEGDYFFLDRKVNTLNDEELSQIRNDDVGFVFQDGGLINDLSVVDNIMISIDYKYRSKYTRQFFHLCEKFNIDGLIYRRTHTLSGGEKQRVALVRALLKDPVLIIADEPTGNLDEINKKIILDYLLDLSEDGKTVLIVSHDLDILNFCNHGYYLEDRKLRSLK
jgi:putative ABC transport system ATP-binding protein